MQRVTESWFEDEGMETTEHLEKTAFEAGHLCGVRARAGVWCARPFKIQGVFDTRYAHSLAADSTEPKQPPRPWDSLRGHETLDELRRTVESGGVNHTQRREPYTTSYYSIGIKLIKHIVHRMWLY